MYSYPRIFETRAKRQASKKGGLYASDKSATGSHVGSGTDGIQHDVLNSRYVIYDEGSVNIYTDNFDPLATYKELKYVWDTSNTSIFVNNELKINETTATENPEDDMGFYLVMAQSGHMYLDWVFVRQHIAEEPTITFGSEETSNQAPNVTITSNITDPLYENVDGSVSVQYLDAEGDNGNISYNWYVNGTSVWNDTDNGIANGSIQTSTISNSYYSAGDLLNVSITPVDNNSNTGTTIWSNTVNISTTTLVSFQLNTPTDTSTTSGINVTLNVTFIDINDTNITWGAYINNATGSALYNQSNFPANTSLIYNWTGLNYASTYYWYAQGKDSGTGNITNSSVWSFTTPTPIIAINWTYPLNNTQHNTSSLQFNYSIYTDHQDVLIDCSLTRDGATVNNSYNLTGDNSTVYNFTETYIAGTEEEYNYSINCSNSYSTDTEDNRTLYIDVESPTMNVSISDNNTYLIPYIFDNNLTFQVNVSDPFLYSLNITDSNGYSNWTNLTGYIFYSFNGTINVTSYPLGLHWLNAEVCDGHTDKELKQDWNVDIGWLSDAITFETETGWTKIYPESWFEMSDVGVDKLKDRYTFDFTLKENKDKLVLYVESSSYIDVLGNKSKYPGHLVIPSQKKWVDFDAQDDSLDYKVKRIEDNLVEITISGLKDKEIKFKSIGELNCISTNSTFGIMNATWTYDVGILEHDWGLHTLNVTWEGIGNACDPTSWSAYLNWNGTDNTATLSDSGVASGLNWNYLTYNKTAPDVDTETDFEVFWRIRPNPNCYGGSLTGDITSNVYTNLTAFNQSIGAFIFDNCSTANATALRFTFADESDLSAINGSMDYTFTFAHYLVEYIGTGTNQSNFTFCIDPEWANAYGDYEIEYSSPGYATRYYTLTTQLTNNITQNITLYLLANTSSETTFIVSDKDTSELLEDVLVKMYRYLNSSWTLVESKLTDITGRAKVTYADSTKYRFIMEKTLYEDLTFDLDPILYEEYNVQMEKSTSLTEAQDHDNIKIYYNPQFFTEGVQNFTFRITGLTSELNSYGVELDYPGGTDSDYGSTASGEEFDFELNITGVTIWDRIRMDYWYDTDLSGNRSFTVYMPVSATNQTFMHNISETYGLGLLERVLIATFIILFIIGIATMMGQTVPGMALSMVVIGFLIYSGFVPIWSFVISIILGVLFLTWLGD